MNKYSVLYFVVPCYNEEAVLLETSKQLMEKLKKLIEAKIISPESRILFIDDGSKDKTWAMIEDLNRENKHICGVKLSRNKGHQNALLAGLTTAKEFADIVISLAS